MRFIFKILISACAVLLASVVVPGIVVAGFGTAVLVAIVLGILNATLGLLLKVLTFPLTIFTFGLFLLVVNALVFWSASFVKGFDVAGFGSAFLGSIIVTIVSLLGKKFLDVK